MTDVHEPAVIVRAARESEKPAILDLTCAAFGERARDRMRTMLWGDSTLRLDDLRVAAIGDELVACVRIADRPIRYGVAQLRVGGIGSVCAHPGYQRRGYASLVLRDADAVMRAGGYQLGMLFTGIPAFYVYRRLGWIPFPEHLAEWIVENNAATELPEPEGVRAFDAASDLPAVQRIYDIDSSGRIGPRVRMPPHWRDEISAVLGIMPSLVVEQGGGVVAYASLRSSETRLEIAEAAAAGGAIQAYEPLAARIWREANERGATTLRAHLPRGHGLIGALQHHSRTPREERTPSWMMLRLLNLRTLLDAAAPELNRRLGLAVCAPGPFDLGIRVDEDYARLALRDGVIQIDTEPADRELTIPADLFFRIFLGEQTAAVLRDQLALAGAALTDRECATLDILFPQRDPIYWWADHF